MDPITAFAAVQSAVKMIKQASAAANDVASLGPLIGKYFDAKHTAVKATREAKKSGGSNMGKAIEIELAIKSQRDFEEQLKGLFFASNNMDVWNSIMERVAQMDEQDKLDAKRARDRALQAKKEREDFFRTLMIAFCVVLLFALVAFGAFAVRMR